MVTPGQNEKRYLAGALDPATGELTWHEGKSKNSLLFCDFIDLLMTRYHKARRVHVVLDNYVIHKSKLTKKRLARHGDRLVLHFLPPYCPHANRIERKWQDLHAAVTRNHTCSTMNALMRRVHAFLRRKSVETPMRLTELAA